MRALTRAISSATTGTCLGNIDPGHSCQLQAYFSPRGQATVRRRFRSPPTTTPSARCRCRCREPAPACRSVSAGPQGPPGPPGSQGPAGPTGPVGPSGLTGRRSPAAKVELITCKTVNRIEIKKINGKRRKVRVKRQKVHQHAGVRQGQVHDRSRRHPRHDLPQAHRLRHRSPPVKRKTKLAAGGHRTAAAAARTLHADPAKPPRATLDDPTHPDHDHLNTITRTGVLADQGARCASRLPTRRQAAGQRTRAASLARTPSRPRVIAGSGVDRHSVASITPPTRRICRFRPDSRIHEFWAL